MKRLAAFAVLLTLPLVLRAEDAPPMPAPDAGAPPSNVTPEAKEVLKRCADRLEEVVLKVAAQANPEEAGRGTSKGQVKLHIDIPGRLPAPQDFTLTFSSSATDAKNRKISIGGDVLEADLYVKDGAPTVFLRGVNGWCDQLPPEFTAAFGGASAGGAETGQPPADPREAIRKAFAKAREKIEHPEPGVDAAVSGTATVEGKSAKVVSFRPMDKPGNELKVAFRDDDGMPANIEIFEGGEKRFTLGALYAGKEFPTKLEGKTEPKAGEPDVVLNAEFGQDGKGRLASGKGTVTLTGAIQGTNVNASLAFDLGMDYDKVPAASDLEFKPPEGARRLTSQQAQVAVQQQVMMKVMPIMFSLMQGGGPPGGPPEGPPGPPMER